MTKPTKPPTLTIVPKSIDAAGDIAALAKRKRPGRGDPLAKGTGGGGSPAGGPGWGGPAKGPGAGPEAIVGEHRMPEAEKVAKIGDKLATADRMLVILSEIAESSEFDATRVSAANAVLDRIEGKAVQRIVGGTTDTVEEIRTRDPIDAAKAYQRVIGGR